MKIAKPITFFTLILLSLILVNQEFQKESFAIEEQDRNQMEAFFKVLLSKHNFAYTLFGDKPCSLAFYGYHKNIPLDLSLQNFDNLILTKGLRCWKKYINHFKNSNFLLMHLKDESDIETIAIINKQALKGTLKKNISLIQTLLDSTITEDELFNKICNDETFLCNFLKSNVLGILLGYGVKNSLAFEKRIELCQMLHTLNVFPFNNLCKHLSDNNALLVKYGTPDQLRSMTGAEPFAIVQELNLLTHEFDTFDLDGSQFCIDQFLSPSFVAYKNDPETKELRDRYTATRDKLIEIYKEKPFLDVTLNQLQKKSA